MKPLSHADDGVDATVVAVAGSWWVPVVNVVDVASRLQPLPPVLSVRSKLAAAVRVWSLPLRVSGENVTVGRRAHRETVEVRAVAVVDLHSLRGERGWIHGHLVDGPMQVVARGGVRPTRQIVLAGAPPSR